MTEWARFASGLAEELREIPAGALLVISEAGGGMGRYVQFAQGNHAVEAELVGDDFLTVEADRVLLGAERSLAPAGSRRAPGTTVSGGLNCHGL